MSREGKPMHENVRHPRRPERICWGCDFYCSVGQMRCGADVERTPHPVELFGPSWHDKPSSKTPEDPETLNAE